VLRGHCRTGIERRSIGRPVHGKRKKNVFRGFRIYWLRRRNSFNPATFCMLPNTISHSPLLSRRGRGASWAADTQMTAITGIYLPYAAVLPRGMSDQNRPQPLASKWLSSARAAFRGCSFTFVIETSCIGGRPPQYAPAQGLQVVSRYTSYTHLDPLRLYSNCDSSTIRAQHATTRYEVFSHTSPIRAPYRPTRIAWRRVIQLIDS